MDLQVSLTHSDLELPPSHPDDDPALNLRGIFSERRAYGVYPNASDISYIGEHGYASYFLRLANASRKIGDAKFKKLRSKGRLDLTSEYVLFHHFRNQLDASVRRRIASLLAESVTHPHAKWESKPQSSKPR
jgi:hypothetical protein